MARKRKRTAKPRYVGLSHYLLNSAAWQSLPAEAVVLLIDLWKRHDGQNNGKIGYSVREAAMLGIGRSTAARLFAVLIDRGFLIIERRSSFTLKTKESREWRLTAEPTTDPPRPASKEFMRWNGPRREPKQRKKKSETQSHNAGTHSPTMLGP